MSRAASSWAPMDCPSKPVLLMARINSSLEKKHLRDLQKQLVRRFATSEVAQDLQQSGFALGGRRVQATVMFSDIRNFTAMVEAQPPEETIELLNTHYTLMFDAISGHGGVINQMIGDALMAVLLVDGATRAALPEGMAVESLGEVPFKGMRMPAQVYAIDAVGAAGA